MPHKNDASYAAAAAVAQKALPGWTAASRVCTPAAEVSDAVPGRTLSELQGNRKTNSMPSSTPDLSEGEASHLVKMVQGNTEKVLFVSGGAVVALQG